MDEAATSLDLLCCIPVEEDFIGEERTEFAETSALCIYYRGAYEGIGSAITTLNEYVQTNAISDVLRAYITVLTISYAGAINVTICFLFQFIHSLYCGKIKVGFFNSVAITGVYLATP